jgi:hypothetical protein
MLETGSVYVTDRYSQDGGYRHIVAFEVIANGSFKLDVTPRSFTSGITSVSVAENTATSTVIYTAVASDQGSLYYEISGADSALFSINTTTDSVGTVVSSAVNVTVTDVAETATSYTVCQSVIELGGSAS